MPRKQNTIHYLYKTTCLITGRYYIGMHSTSNLEDGYMGSGKRLRYSLRKYGVENHIKEILEFFDSRELLVEAEKKAITTDILDNVMCMNLKGGGYGGFCNEEHRSLFFSSAQNVSKMAGTKGAVKLHAKRVENEEFDIEWKSNISKSLVGKQTWWCGKSHNESTKQKISSSMLGKSNGEYNSQYGTMWITNGTENRKIKKEEIIPEGWYKGRK